MRWIKNLPPFTRNFYFLFGVLFLVWMLFFDPNDLITQYKLSRKLNNLENQRNYYLQKIEEVKQERNELFSDHEMLEKFARENYLMKKKEEDLYIIVEEE